MLKLQHNSEIEQAMQEIATDILLGTRWETYMQSIFKKPCTPKITRAYREKLKEYFPEFVGKYNFNYSSKELLENPYVKTVDLTTIQDENVKLTMVQVPHNIITHQAYMDTQYEGLKKFIGLGYYDDPISIPVLSQDNETWMSPSFMEINSVQAYVDAATGKVATIGLGLGYFTFMVARKPEVTKVVVVEYNPTVINLFKTYILPQFPTEVAAKIEIIQGDLFDYYNETFLNEFDFVFIDTWKNTQDGLFDFYIPLMEKLLPPDHVRFWIEADILHPVQVLIGLYLKTLYVGDSIADLIGKVDNSDRLLLIKINRYFKAQKHSIETAEELYAYVTNKEILRKILGGVY